MLSIGGQLYNLTDRDRATLLLEPFFRVVGQAWGIGTGQIDQVVSWPADRFLWLQNITTDWSGGAAAARVTQLESLWRESSAASGIRFKNYRGGDVIGDGQSVATQNGSKSEPGLGLLLPPGQILVRLNRSDTTVAGSVATYVCAYLVPPGGIGRAA